MMVFVGFLGENFFLTGGWVLVETAATVPMNSAWHEAVLSSVAQPTRSNPPGPTHPVQPIRFETTRG